MSAHEDLSRAEEQKMSSDKSFGLVMTVFFAIIALLPLLHGGRLRWWALAVSGFSSIVTILQPKLLHPANFLWTKLAVLLNKVMNPIVTGLLFYLVFTPTGLILSLCGKDSLQRRFDPNCASYWRKRLPPGPEPQTMSNQF